MKANKKFMFARFGSLSRHFYEMLDKEGNKKYTFHTPPVNRGIYAYIWPYIEPFLAAWNPEVYKLTDTPDGFGGFKKKLIPIKKFSHDGDLWCHFVDQARKLNVGKKYVGSWVLINTKDLYDVMKKVANEDIKLLHVNNSYREIKNPYKRGQGGNMSRDHLEVFIENIRENKRNSSIQGI